MTLVIVAFLIALCLSLILGVPYLEYLKKNFYGQYIREEGPESHAQKSGTPTMGGVVLFLSAIAASTLALVMYHTTCIEAIIVLLSTLVFMFAGFIDDYKKVTKKQNKGLSAKNKILLQLVGASIPIIYLALTQSVYVNFFDIAGFNLGYFYLAWAAFIIIGASNAINLTDGLDGLATSTSAISFLTLTIILAYSGFTSLAIIAASIAGACLGFLYFNKYPAKIFMGDTGSLALGGALGSIAVLSKQELWLLLIAIVFIIETLSVIIQVTSFKTTGKRVFKMAPIHHHFELLGWKETKVTKVFATFGLLFCIIALVLKFYVL